MYDKLKEDSYNNYMKNGTMINYDGNLDLKCFEIPKDNLKWVNERDVPLAYTQNHDNSIFLSAIPELMEFAVNYAEQFSDRLFSDEAINYLYDNVEVEKLNMKPFLFFKWYGIVYAIDDINNLNLAKKQDTTVSFKKDTEYEILKQYVMLHGEYGSTYFGTLIDNKIVSIAICNWDPDMHPEWNLPFVNIGLSTNEDYTQKGYGVSNLVAITEYHLKKGRIVTGYTGSNNLNAQKAVLTAGFKEAGRTKKLFCTKTDDCI